MLSGFAKRLAIAFLLVSPLPLGILAYVYINNFETIMREEILKRASVIADKKSDKIELFMQERVRDVAALASRSATVDGFRKLAEAYHRFGPDSGYYAANDRQFRKAFRRYLELYGYYDLLLIDTTGTVIFSIEHERDFRTNLLTGHYKGSILAEGFKAASRYLEAGNTGFEPYEPTASKPAQFITSPIVHEDRLIGVLALQVNLEQLYSVLLERTGLGETGEAVFAKEMGEKIVFTTPLRYKPEERFSLKTGDRNLIMWNALKGERGAGVGTDYRYEEVIGAWRYIPSINWGMVVKIDTSEALRPVHNAKQLSFFVLVVMLVLSGATAYAIGRNIIKPIRRMIVTADEIATGKLDTRLTEEGTDEVGTLSRSFNRMADSLQEARTGLEKKVVERTEEFQEAVDKLEKEIYERMRAQKELKGLKETAEASSRAKSEFLANMSHEIRTPMNAITGLSYLALRTKLDMQQRGYVQKIQSAADSLLGIINDILDMSKVEAGKLSLESTAFILDDVLQHVFNIVNVKALEKGIEILLAKDLCIPKQLTGDPLRLGQVLINLINNAVKFTDSGQVVLSSGIESEDEKAGTITLLFSVKDSGIGMAREDMDRIFEVFTQADTSSTRKYGGTGLGLAISKTLVEMMGGRIEVESELGKGSKFSFTAVFRTAEDKASSCLRLPQNLRGMPVLVVDGNPISREILRHTLEALSFRAASVGNAGEAITRLKQTAEAGDEPCRIIFMDWNMMMDESEAASRIKDIVSPHPVIIMVTAYGGEDVITRGVQYGADAFLLKPFTPSTLFDTIMKFYTVPSGEHPAFKLEEQPDRLTGLLNGKVLLAEDNEVNRMIAVEILNSFGLVVETAANGRDAFERLAGNPLEFDLVLMDIQMPEMDGYEATARLRGIEALRNMPIIAMTAHAMTEDRERCLSAGMNDHISKPIEPALLFSIMQKWLKPSTRPGEIKAEPGRTTTDTAPVNLPGIDIRSAMNRLHGNNELLVRLYRSFKDKHGAVTKEIKSAISSGNYEDAQRINHTLKGSSGNLSMTDLYKISSELEKAIGKRDIESCSRLTEELEGRMRTVLDSIITLTRSDETSGGASDTANIQVNALHSPDTKALASALPEFYLLLKKQSLSARKKAAQIEGLLKDTEYNAELNAIKNYIDRLDFKGAREETLRLAEKTGVRVE